MLFPLNLPGNFHLESMRLSFLKGLDILNFASTCTTKNQNPSVWLFTHSFKGQVQIRMGTLLIPVFHALNLSVSLPTFLLSSPLRGHDNELNHFHLHKRNVHALFCWTNQPSPLKVLPLSSLSSYLHLKKTKEEEGMQIKTWKYSLNARCQLPHRRGSPLALGYTYHKLSRQGLRLPFYFDMIGVQ